jgi:putative flippase GtrA
MSHLSTAVARSAARFGLTVPATLVAFIGVGFTGLAVNLGLLMLFEKLGMPFQAALALALLIATGIGWQINRRVTFVATGRKPHHEALRYFAVALVAQGVNYAASLGVSALSPHWPHVADAFCGAVVATAFSYTGQRFFTFAPKRAEPDA